MKKIIFIVCLLFLVIGGTSFAEHRERSGDILTITPDINQKSIEDINHIGLVFCNNGIEIYKQTKQLAIEAQPGKRQEICAIFDNRFTDRDVKLNAGFVEGTKKSEGVITCGENTSGNILSNMMEKEDRDYTFMVPRGKQFLKKFKITIPSTSTGVIYGCIAYNLPDNYSQASGAMFGILVRKVAPIVITITGDVYKFGRWNDIKDEYSANKNDLFKAIIALLGIWIVISIVNATKKKENHHHKKK